MKRHAKTCKIKILFRKNEKILSDKVEDEARVQLSIFVSLIMKMLPKHIVKTTDISVCN